MQGSALSAAGYASARDHREEVRDFLFEQIPSEGLLKSSLGVTDPPAAGNGRTKILVGEQNRRIIFEFQHPVKSRRTSSPSVHQHIRNGNRQTFI